MATYTIVDKDKDPLDPGEINAGGTIQVNDGDIFIIDATADKVIKFEAASGTSTDFEIQIDDSNSNNFNIEINDDLNADITIADDVDIADISIKAKDSESTTLTAGDNVTIDKYEGSETGADSLTIGDGFTANSDILTYGGDDDITIGEDATVEDIDTGDGDDTIDIGGGLTAVDIKTGDGANEVTIGVNAVLSDIVTGAGQDTITIGDGVAMDNIQTGDGDDDITIGNDAVINDIESGKGADGITIGDNADLGHIHTGDGDDTVTLGDDYTGEHVSTEKGDDLVIVGTGGSIDDLDGGAGNDTLDSQTNFPDATSFETICFADGTLIRTERGDVPVEMLVRGDLVETLDHGLQRVRWIGSSFVTGRGAAAPVQIRRDALGNTRDLWVSQQHRILISGWQAELYFGEPQVLVPAKHLVDGDKIEIVEKTCVGYFHILFDRHEIVFSEGIASESFHPGQIGIATLSDASRAEIYRVFPDIRADPGSYGPPARPSLRAHEGKLLAA